MHRSRAFRPLTLCLAAAVACSAGSVGPASPGDSSPAGRPVYHPDPQHLWNRLHHALWIRAGANGKEYGHDRLDPLLWRETHHLLEGKSHEQAIAILDEFLAKNADKLLEDPCQRAFLQRDLWAVFDWTTEPGTPQQESQRRALQVRLTSIIRKLGLSAERIGTLREIDPGQIRGLPDNYAAAVKSRAFAEQHDPNHIEQPFLPPDLFKKDGPWVEVRKDNGSIAVAPTHVHDFAARSAFRVFLRLPEGRNATRAYLAKLHAMSEFPVGTQMALVRQMLLIDKDGKLALTPVTESVQLRVHRLIPTTGAAVNRLGPADSPEQEGHEFRLSRSLLFAGKTGGLRPLGPNDKDFRTQFRVHGFDYFESPSTRDQLENRMEQPLKGCVSCHRGRGVHSFLTYSGGFFPRGPHLPDLDEDTGSERYGGSQGRFSALRKREQYSWGLLQGLWSNLPGR